MSIYKKVLTFLLCFVLPISLFYACGDNGNGDKDPEDIYNGERKMLMFEIDEGMGGYEFVSGCKKADGSYDYARMDLILENIYDGIKDLTEVYDVTVHIYANWYYNEKGWFGKDPSNAINKWGDDLFYAMDFFESKGIGVWLEIMSSGVYTNQNSELGTLPIVDIFHGTAGKTERKVKGIAADLAALKALKQKYTQTFLGVRFHELIGTHNCGLAGNPHCFTIEEQDVYALIDTCAEAGLKLVWSDHAWDEMYTINQYWKQRVLYAQEKLGDDLTIMWANNSGSYITGYLNFSLYERLEQDFPQARLGFSNQNWFTSAFYLNRGAEPVTGPAETDNPVEIAAGFTVRAFMEGAWIVQYEPSYQFFNWPRSLHVTNELGHGGSLPGAGTRLLDYTPPAGTIEGEDFDYSARVELRRLVQLLNDKSTQFADVQNFYDSNLGRMSQNVIENPPKTYTQTTVGVRTSNGYAYFDQYNNKPGTWLRQDENRFTDRVMAGEVLKSAHLLINDHAYDAVINAVKENGRVNAYIYTARSGLLVKDTSIFADDADGQFLTFTTANLIKSRVDGVNMDTDEIIVARSKDGQINLSLYQAVTDTSNVGIDRSARFRYQKVTGTVDSSVIDEMLGGKTFSANNFIGISGIRSTVALGKTSRKRAQDGLVMVYQTQDGVSVFGKRRELAAQFNGVYPIDGTVTAFATGTAGFDIGLSESLIFAVNKGGETVLRFYNFKSDNTTLIQSDTELTVGNANVHSLFTMRKAYFIYDSSLD